MFFFMCNLVGSAGPNLRPTSEALSPSSSRGGGVVYWRIGCRRRFGLDQEIFFSVIVEDFGVAAPVPRCFELALYLVLGEVLVEDIVKKFIVDGMIRLALKDAVDLFQDGDMFKRSLTEEYLAALNVGISEFDPFRSDLDIALFQ